GEGQAYHDTTPGNEGGAFRNTDVDLQQASVGGYNVGWTDAGEWLRYTVNVTAAGKYTTQLQVASVGGGKMQLSFGAPSDSSANIVVPNTGDWQKWTTVTVTVNLKAGQRTMLVRFLTAGINLKSVTVGNGTSAPAPPPSAPAPPPPASGQTISVNAGGDLQAAIDAARPGDTILLQAGATFVGNFVLRAKGSSTSYITIRSSAADSALPGPGVRMTPAYASQLPKLRSPNTAPALS